MNKFVKILLGTLAGVIIVGTILKQSGVISKIHDDNEIDKMAEEKRSWESKAVGNAKFIWRYMIIQEIRNLEMIL